MEYGTGLRPRVPYVVVKVPVFSFSKMRGVETILGPEMKSTGEVLGLDDSFGGALRKGFLAAGVRLPGDGGRILVSIADEEKHESVPLLRRYAELGHSLVATPGTRAVLEAAGIRTTGINKIAQGSPHVLDLIASRGVDLVINDAKGPREISDNYKIRRAAVEASIACLTSLDTARALVEALASTAGPPRSLQEYRSALAMIGS
jgi:carbamoyl-phosphate synthase large subunit